MLRTIVAVIFMVVWGAATIVVLVQKHEIPPEYWTLPALGLGGLLAALGSSDKKKSPRSDPPGQDSKPEGSAT